MKPLYNPDIYSDQVREMILQSGEIGIEIHTVEVKTQPRRQVRMDRSGSNKGFNEFDVFAFTEEKSE